ncbi:MAG TPA: metallophosphoesterase family protein [Gaiellaceae bacterium]|nr:metallophosphoesterase family protein [Gaiellaceae bacterium]
MSVAAISDIHGNLPALEAVLADIEREGVDEIVVAGDSVSGPWPAEVFDLLDEAGARIVHGNADRADEVARFSQEVAVWNASRLGSRRLATVATWPSTVAVDIEGLGRVLVCHSTPSSDLPIYTRITPDEEVLTLLGSVEADVLVCGHTHMQYDRTLSNGLRLVNPGSVGMPYEGRPGAFWALLGPDVAFRHSAYDIDAAVAAMGVLGAPRQEDAENLLTPPGSDETTEYFESLRAS